MLKIRMSRAAKQDMQDSARYYNKQQRGLGRRFEKTIKNTLRRIQQMPESASFAFDEARYKTVENFPYIVLYRFDNKYISIIRVFNTFQDDVAL